MKSRAEILAHKLLKEFPEMDGIGAIELDPRRPTSDLIIVHFSDGEKIYLKASTERPE